MSMVEFKLGTASQQLMNTATQLFELVSNHLRVMRGACNNIHPASTNLRSI